jgi:Integrase zinc binding domain
LHRQAQWMEFLSQYDHTIIYIKGKDNMVADTLSHLSNDIDITALPPIATMLAIQMDTSLLKSIIDGYETDPFCIKLKNAEKSIEGVHWANGLLYIGDCLIIPHVGTLREDLFHLMHDSLGHFSFDKSYATLHDTYYWPNLC